MISEDVNQKVATKLAHHFRDQVLFLVDQKLQPKLPSL
jgi:hypothetical protein